jgi:hypothetical protein
MTCVVESEGRSVVVQAASTVRVQSSPSRPKAEGIVKTRRQSSGRTRRVRAAMVMTAGGGG